MTARIADRDTADRLYQSTMDGTAETSGDAEAPCNWFALVMDDDGTWYLLIHDSLGFTHGYAYDSESEARGHYEDLEDEYSEWLAADEV